MPIPFMTAIFYKADSTAWESTRRAIEFGTPLEIPPVGADHLQIFLGVPPGGGLGDIPPAGDTATYMDRMPACHRISGIADLALFLDGGGSDSFTGSLLRLISKADPANLVRLGAAFPRETRAWAIWNCFDQVPTADQLAMALARHTQ